MSRVEFACAVSRMLDAKEELGTTPTTIGLDAAGDDVLMADDG